ncbi:hypothetical protein DQ04_06991030 [Trypanosoma grayi]|uniref:hypothetical protein n=1 Tax=Trypanosoma grayi TaxID=71804 RepID=UPI0004F3FBD6|nr:hypothetical protein DQ04_06991030 [Trypanosoma grayi]KEG08524.1 hypothetical protein DQ04_06991030 [Trypanosoma grayi]
MSGAKSPLSGSAKTRRCCITPSGESGVSYRHNPYSSPVCRSDTSTPKCPNPCRHHAEGRCNRGSTCRFYHEETHNIITAPHITPKQRSITPLTGIPQLTALMGGFATTSPTILVDSPIRPKGNTATTPAAAASSTTAKAQPPVSDVVAEDTLSPKYAQALLGFDVGFPVVDSVPANDSLTMASPLNSNRYTPYCGSFSGSADWSPKRN